MRKTLLSLMALGSLALGSAGCEITPQGMSFGQGLIMHAAQEEISKQVNPNQTNIYVNPGNQNPENQEKYWIDENLLDGSERDLQEAKAVYRVLVIDCILCKNPKEKVADLQRGISLNGCPEKFKRVYEEHIKAWGEYGNNPVIGSANVFNTWDNVILEALKEGVRKKE